MSDIEKELLESIALVDELRARLKLVKKCTIQDMKTFGTDSTPIGELIEAI